MEKKTTSYFGEYLKYSIFLCIQTKIFFFLLSLLEIFDLITNLLDQIIRIFYKGKIFNINDDKLTKQILSASPYNYFFKYLSKTIKIEQYLSNNIYFMIFYFALIIHFIIFFLSLPIKDYNIVPKLERNIYYKIVVNFYNFIFYRIFTIYAFDLFSREIMKLLFIKEYKIIDYILLFVFFLFLITIYIWHLIYIQSITIWTNIIYFEKSISFPFDNYFSSKYDIMLLTIKLIILINKNYYYFNGNIIDYIILFNIFLIFVIFYGYSLYLIYIYFFSVNCLYIFQNFYNLMRHFNILLIFELIPLRIIFHDKDGFRLFYFFLAFFIFFDLFIIVNFLFEIVYTKGIKCQNYLSVGTFIGINKIDITNFITQWIINHKSECLNDNCPICLELINNEEIENNEKVEIQRNTIIIKENNKLKLNINKDKINENNSNSINKIFTPYKFNIILLSLLKKYENDFNYEDSIRYDFLYLSGLFLSNYNIEFLLYSDLYLLMQKYKNNINIVVIIRLIFNTLQKSNQTHIKNFDLLKKNDNLLLSLKNFIKDYENFIIFSTKSPDNYLDMSVKFKDFKETVKIMHSIFKKNTERDYQLIIMRFAYDSLLHKKHKHENLFDYSIYYEFLSDRFETDKIILIKYLIDKDIFTIIKCSKDFIKYEGSNFENIFPNYLKKILIENFKIQLKNNEQKDYNQIFETIIKNINYNNIDNDNFIEAFRMEYFIYLSLNINELFIFGKKYSIGKNEYIIFEHKKDKTDIIFAFSFKIYKYLGITPEMLLFLRKLGIFLEKESIFINKNGTNEYIFKFSTYYPIFKKIISNEALVDFPDYSTILERKNEIHRLAKEEKEIIFIISLKSKYNYFSSSLDIYDIKEQIKKNGRFKRKALEYREKSENSEEISNELSGEKIFEFNNQSLSSADIVSSFSFNSNKDLSQLTGNNKGKQSDKNYERIKSLKTINRFTLIILLFDIFLIILSIFFLILEVKEYNFFKNILDLFQTFKIFKRGIESASCSLVLNYKFIQEIDNKTKDVLSTINIYENYSNTIMKQFPSMNSLQKIYKVIQAEIYGKNPYIVESFNKYLTELFKINNKAINRIKDLQGFYVSLQKEDKITLYLSYSNFISLCREYNNFLSNLLLDNIYLTQNISLLNLEMVNELNYNIHSQYDFEFTSTIKYMILLVFVYPSIHIGLAESSYFMQQEFHNSIDFMEKFMIIFFILFMSLHIILIIIMICFFVIYLKLLKININSANKLFMDKKYIIFQSQRLELLKILTTLYSVNPVNLFDKINILEEKYKRKTHQDRQPVKNEFKNLLDAQNNINIEDYKKNKERISNVSYNNIENINASKTFKDKEDKKENKNNEKLENNNNENNEEDDENSPLVIKNYTISQKLFNKTIITYKYIFIYLFIIYFIYCIIFFIFVMLGINRLRSAIIYCEVNNKIDELIYDNLNSIIFMYITNSTPYFYNGLIYGNTTKNYLEIGINNLYSNIQQKENIEYLHSNLFPPINIFTKLNCSESYIQDENFIEAANILYMDYNEYIRALCDVFPVAKTNNDLNILYEILYMTEELYRNFETNNYNFIFKNYLLNPIFCECFTLLFTFNKIIRTYFNDHIYPEEVYNISKYFRTLIIAYLVLSVIFEIIFFIILNFTILQKIKYKNELMLDFIDSLKF